VRRQRKLARKIARLIVLSEWAYLVGRLRPYIDLGVALLLSLCVGGFLSTRFGDATLYSWLSVLALDLGLRIRCAWLQLHIEKLMQDVAK
jgi:hypothetical protein